MFWYILLPLTRAHSTYSLNALDEEERFTRAPSWHNFGADVHKPMSTPCLHLAVLDGACPLYSGLSVGLPVFLRSQCTGAQYYLSSMSHHKAQPVLPLSQPLQHVQCLRSHQSTFKKLRQAKFYAVFNIKCCSMAELRFYTNIFNIFINSTI